MIKLNSKDYQIYFTSDLHLGHDKEFVWKERGFDSIASHTNACFDSLSSISGSRSILFNLGDACLTSNHADNFERLSSIDFLSHYFVNGNHNSPARQMQAKGEKSFHHIQFLGDYEEISIDKQRIILSHFPFLSWNDMRNGSWHLHGHEHGQLKASLPDNKDGKRLDVGVDVALKYGGKFFLTWEDVCEIMNEKNKERIGHH